MSAVARRRVDRRPIGRRPLVPGLAAASVAVGVLLMLGACKAPFSASPAAAPTPRSPSNAPTPPAAELPGGACLLMDFEITNDALGSSFDVSAAADTSGTYMCLLQGAKASLPSLSVAITATTLLPSDFTTDVVPKGSKAVSGLGLIGYEVVKVSGTDEVAEVGWLSGNDRLIIMDYTFAAGSTADDANALLPKMVSLAKTVDSTTV